MAASSDAAAKGPSANKLFVGNISYRITARELRLFFNEFGPVCHCQIVKDHKKGWSRGIGFVTFENSETAAKALSASPDDLVLDSRTLRLAAADTPKRVKLAQGGSVESAEGGCPASEEDELDGERQIGYRLGSLVASTESYTEQKCDSPDEVGAGSVTADREGRQPELNDDLWLMIFSGLDIRDRVMLEGVCKRWQRLAILSWRSLKRLSFENMFKSIFRAGKHDKLLHMFLKRCGTGLLSLDLSSAPPYHLTEYSLDLVGQYCRSLRHLNLAHMAITRVALKTMAQRLTQLQSVNLQHSKGAGEKALWWLLNSLKSLEYLNVADNKRITGQFFYQAGGALKEVILNDCSQLTDEGVSFLSQRSPHLEVLHLCRCGRLTGQAVASLTENCQKLRKLYFVSECYQNIHTRDLLHLGSFHELTELVLDRHDAVTDEVMSKIGRNCPKLKYISCEACHSISDVGTRHLESCPDLQHIVLSYCDKFTDAGLQHLGATHDGLERVVLRACPLINDNAVVQLCLSCPKLATLDISGCVSVTDKVLPPLLEFLSFPHPEGRPQISMSLGGTSVNAEKAVQFARATGTPVSLHDLSLSYLAADYDPYMNLAPFREEEEDWEQDNFPHTTLAVGQPGGAEVPGLELAEEYHDDEREAELEDFLVGDDPAVYSDEFSGPEDEF